MKKVVRIKNHITIVSVLFLLLGNSSIEAQRKRTPAKPKPVSTTKKQPETTSQNTGQKQSTLNTTGLEKSDFFRYIHDGRFTRIENDMRFKMTVEGYVTSFSNRCQSLLSKDRVEITKYVDTYRSETTFIPWGRTYIPVTSQRLAGSKVVGTGIYAEPEFAEVYSRLTGGYLLDFMRNVQRPNLNNIVDALIKSTADAIEISIQTYSDMNKLLENNGCNSPATKRFSENLLRLSKGQQSVQATNGEKSYFVRECESKLPKLFPKNSPTACGCIEREFYAVLPNNLVYPLEDKFDTYDFKSFLLLSFYRAGLQEKVSACIKN